tara:strand:+ start:542 stop:853 length:312 start_codon:yes stop_codon:yes gene_type:complete
VSNLKSKQKVSTKKSNKSNKGNKKSFEIKIGSSKLTRFEQARIIGARSLELAYGAPTFVKIDSKTRDPMSIATKELKSKSLPISIRRLLPDGEYQDIPIDQLV